MSEPNLSCLPESAAKRYSLAFERHLAALHRGLLWRHRLNNLPHSLQIFFKCFKPKFLLALIAKKTMDRAKFGFLCVEIHFPIYGNRNKMAGDVGHPMGEVHDVAADEKFKILCDLREAVRHGFIVYSKIKMVRYVACFPYQCRVYLDFFIEQYAFKLFPPLPAPKELGEGNPEKGGDRRKNAGENAFVHF